MYFRLNARKSNGLKMRVGTAKTVSRKRKYSFASSTRIDQLKQIRLKDTTESKVNWAVTAYNDWRNERLFNYQYDVGIYEADLNDLPNLTKENLQHALCHFIPEVTKIKGEGPYPGRTLYEMIVAIQKYLKVNKIFWQLVDGYEFIDLHTVLDNIMQERTAMNVGVLKKQAMVISYETEKKLWERDILGEDTPEKLRNTVLFLLGINVYLRAVEEHYQLRRASSDQPSQLNFEYNDKGIKCLVYHEDCVTKTHDGGLGDMRRERKVVWVYPSSDETRCPVRLVGKYLSLCPEGTKRSNFYLQGLQKPTPKRWYSNQVVGQQKISKVVKTMMKEANIEGFFTNHSLRRTGGTRLFRAGVDRKLVKEATGHRSDSVDAYQITSDEQRQEMSKIIARPPSASTGTNRENDVNSKESKSIESDVTASNVGEIVSKVITAMKGQGKTTIKLQIEITTE